jgi:hypothetical protein
MEAFVRDLKVVAKLIKNVKGRPFRARPESVEGAA